MNMVRVFITGSSDGIGQAVAKNLVSQGHQVTLHARNAERAKSAMDAVPQAEGVLVADLSSIAETKKLAEDANALWEPFDTVIHNAGIGYGSTSSRVITGDGISAVFAVNTLAPYILTCVMKRPSARLLYVSSDSHYSGDETLRNATQSHSYGNSKLHEVMLAKAVARRWTSATAGGGGSGESVQVLSMHPGWVRTKMGGMAAPGSLDKPARGLAEWAAGEGRFTGLKSGAYFTMSGEGRTHPGAGSVEKQEELVRICEGLSGCKIPED